MTRLGVEQKLAVPINGRNCKHGSGRYGKMKIYMLARACVSFPTRNHRALACVTHEQTYTHAHMYKEHTYSVYTYTSLPHMRSSVHTYSSGLHTLSSVRSCKTEERSKRLLLPCCCCCGRCSSRRGWWSTGSHPTESWVEQGCVNSGTGYVCLMGRKQLSHGIQTGKNNEKQRKTNN